MSFFSDLGSIAREFNDIKDEIAKTVNDAAQDAVSAVSQAQDDLYNGVTSVSNGVDSAARSVTNIGKKKIDIIQPIKGSVTYSEHKENASKG